MHNSFQLILFVLISILSQSIQAQTNSDISLRERSCSDKSAKIMILGTYHMNNNNLDTFNIEADDVLLPKRQGEITELIEKLARFNPTKIAIEAAYSDKDMWDSRYKKILAGELKLGRNEIDQIGFQLAKRLNHQTIYPIDYRMFMSGLRYDEVELPKPKPSPSPSQESNNSKSAPPQTLSAEDMLLRKSTIVEFLRYLNNEEKIQAGHVQYMRMLLPNDNPAIYESADRVTNWYKRNLRMFANINRIAEFPNDRILLVVGSGHLKILRDFAIDSPQFCLIEADSYLK